ncbi:hypothetical protein ACHQM5_025688 [Ranunculus cassubicifolius]
MSFRNQNKPPLTPNIPTNNISIKKSETKRIPGMSTSRTRQDNNNSRDESASSDCNEIELNKEMVEQILKERIKIKKTELKLTCDQMGEYIRKLRLCVKWYQDLEETYLLGHQNLQTLLDSSQTKCTETEKQMQMKTHELDARILHLTTEHACLETKFTELESEKMAVIENLKKEQEARLSDERIRASLAEDLERSLQELKRANQTIESLTDACRTSQEYNTGLQQYNATLQKDCDTYKTNIKRLEQEKAAIFENHITVKHRYQLLQEELTSFQDSRDDALKQRDAMAVELCCVRHELQQARDDMDCQQLQIQNITAELVNYREVAGNSSAELDGLSKKLSTFEETCSCQMEEIQILQHQLAAANEKLKMANLSSLETRIDYEDQKRLVQDLQNRLADSEFQIVEAENLRKKLHNTILELKGNIRVFCRVRPMLPDDGSGSEASAICYPTSTDLHGRGIDLLQSGQKHQFTFDKVFTHDSTQKDVFVEISQLVQSALDGYKVCIFAYGQTGSGKTYTMMGRPESMEQKGLIPRSLEQIFESSQNLMTQGWKYKMQASMLEIYNETIRDLLNREDNGPSSHSIKHDTFGNTHVSDLTIVDVCSLKEVSSLLHQAAQSRSVGKTHMNEQSSRSHLVFTLRIVGVNESTDQRVCGVLNLIDLAGSERLSKSGATGDRLKETQAINKSLSALSDVIFSLAKKEDHVPFRNSKLTYLLQPCLGGNSKTLMFVNISPSLSSVGESLCSLRFAAKVNACEIGVPRLSLVG